MNLSWLLPDVKGIPVLMYHKVWPGGNDALTITPERLRKQWEYLKKEGYKALSLSEFLAVATGKSPAVPRSVLITFDDGYLNNLQYAYPLLQELGLKAAFFIIANTLDGTAAGESGEFEKMTPAQLKTLDPEVVQLGMHGYAHENFGKISEAEMTAAIAKAKQAFDGSGLPYYPVWAYAYGARPAGMDGLKKALADAGIQAAFRIGNKVNKIPVQDIFQIKRIDIRGTDTVEELKIKLKKGKLKPF